jgi:hypothetical protein
MKRSNYSLIAVIYYPGFQDFGGNAMKFADMV